METYSMWESEIDGESDKGERKRECLWKRGGESVSKIGRNGNTVIEGERERERVRGRVLRRERGERKRYYLTSS